MSRRFNSLGCFLVLSCAAVPCFAGMDAKVDFAAMSEDVDRIGKIAAVKFSAIAALAHGEAEMRQNTCRILQQRWPDFAKDLGDLPNRSAIAVRFAERYLAAIAHSCSEPFSATHAPLKAMAEIGGAFVVGSFAYPAALKKIFPVSGKNQAEIFHLFFPEARESVRTNLCVPSTYVRFNLPDSPLCMADYVYSRLTQSEALSRPLATGVPELAAIRTAVESIDGPVKAWSSVLSIPFEPIHQGSVVRYRGSRALAEKIVLGQPIKTTVSLLNFHGESLLPVLEIPSTGSGADLECGRFASRIREIVKLAPFRGERNSPEFLPILGSLVGSLCGSRAYAETTSILKMMNPRYGFMDSMSTVGNVEAYMITEAESEIDMVLRDQLGLRFHYGSQFDVTDFDAFSLTDRENAVVDSVVAQIIRGGDSLPWVHLSQDIEDLDGQLKFLRESAASMAKSTIPAKRLLQIFYLQQYDFSPMVESDRQVVETLIKNIRSQSQYLKAMIPEFRHIGNVIHNGIHKGTLDIIDDFSRGLSEEAKSAHSGAFLYLKKMMERLFWADLTPVQALVQSAEILPEDNALRQRIVRGLRDGGDDVCVDIVSIAGDVMRDIDRLEAAGIDSSAQKAEYLKKLRILRFAHDSVVACTVVGSHLPYAYLQTLFGAGKDISLVKVRRMVEESLHQRVALFVWFLATQYYRYTPIDSLSKARERRLSASMSLLGELSQLAWYGRAP